MKINLTYIIIACLLIMFGWSCYRLSQVKNQRDIIEQNYRAASDSLHTFILDNEYLMYEKDAYILKESELTEILDITQKELNEVKKKLNSSIDYISKIDGMVKVDTIYASDTIFYNKDSIPFISFGYKDEWLSINGTTNFKPLKTTITNIQIPLTVETGLTTDNNIFVKTDNPYVTIQDVRGAIINDKKFKIDLRHKFYIGMGLQYGLFNNDIDFGPQFGYGFSITF